MIMMNCAGQSKTTDDTLCFPRKVLEKVLIAAQQKKVLDSQIVLLNQRIEGLESVINELNGKDQLTVQSYEAQLKQYQAEKALYEDQLKGYERLIRKEKRKRIVSNIFGGLAAAAAVFLFVTK